MAWLRQQVEARLYLARHAVELGNAEHWTELSSGVLMTCAPDAPQEGWDGVHPLGDSSVTRLMEANDPRDTIARCAAELAVLEELTAARARREAEQNDYDAWVRGETTAGRAPFTGPDLSLIPGLERAVRLLSRGYRHHDGWRGHWGMEAAAHRAGNQADQG